MKDIVALILTAWPAINAISRVNITPNVFPTLSLTRRPTVLLLMVIVTLSQHAAILELTVIQIINVFSLMLNLECVYLLLDLHCRLPLRIPLKLLLGRLHVLRLLHHL